MKRLYLFLSGFLFFSNVQTCAMEAGSKFVRALVAKTPKSPFSGELSAVQKKKRFLSSDDKSTFTKKEVEELLRAKGGMGYGKIFKNLDTPKILTGLNVACMSASALTSVACVVAPSAVQEYLHISPECTGSLVILGAYAGGILRD